MAGVRPHFKVHVSIATHRNTAEMWRDPMCRGIYVELGRLAMARYAGKNDDTFHISTADIIEMTGVETAGAASQRWSKFLRRCEEGARKLGGRSPVGAEKMGRHWRVTLRNFAKKHGMKANNATPKIEDRRRKMEERRTTPKPPSPDPPSASGLRVADRLKSRILSLSPRARVPKTVDRWAREYDAIMSRDSRTEDELVAQADWLFGANQVAEKPFVVMSPKSHGEKFDRIVLAMQRATRATPPSRPRVTTPGVSDWTDYSEQRAK